MALYRGLGTILDVICARKRGKTGSVNQGVCVCVSVMDYRNRVATVTPVPPLESGVKKEAI